jgi:hypothetical protein
VIVTVAGDVELPLVTVALIGDNPILKSAGTTAFTVTAAAPDVDPLKLALPP